MTVLSCIVEDHNLWLVLLAFLLCVAGSWATMRLFQRTLGATGWQKIGWHFLTALCAGVAIWCTHFIAMLGFDSGVPVGFDLPLTVASLLIAVVGSTIGGVVAGSGLGRFGPLLGGAIVGVSIAAMHYTGMIAYRVQGLVSWDMRYLAASIVFAVVFSALALHVAVRRERQGRNLMAGLFATAIITLHFIGMAAFRVTPMEIEGNFANPEALRTLAFAIACMALVIVAAGLVSYLIDDSTRAEAIERLRRMALNDTLTALPNRVSFNDRLDFEIELAREHHGRIAIVGIDLNRFKEINDLRGHTAGDEVLRVLGWRMRSLLREGEGEFIARIGGDEFAALYRLGDQAGLFDFLARLEGALFGVIQHDGYEVTPGASFGVAIYPDDASTKAALINNADLAMYRAKADPTQTVCFYEPSMDDAARARRSLAADLREVVERGELSIHYQVQMAVKTGEIRGYEALVRWHHPTLGFVPPSEFIPLAEENGLILKIGEWVLREACREAAGWEKPCRVAVNLSAVQLSYADLPGLVREVLAETGLPPGRLELELTETAIFADRERARHVLQQIRDLGVGLALDDFGTGYSSLDTLSSFSFDKIKLDQSFIGETSSHARAIVCAVLALGRSLNIPVLAEGIETEEQLAMLTREGCTEVQGFLLGRPVPSSEILCAAPGKRAERLEVA
ncbi:putative bifunctional diguanylate cyclase/phosphodiesterase [Xanthobacteraceae bacterium A53D]